MHRVFGTTMHLAFALLAPVALHFRRGQAFDTNARQRLMPRSMPGWMIATIYFGYSFLTNPA